MDINSIEYQEKKVSLMSKSELESKLMQARKVLFITNNQITSYKSNLNKLKSNVYKTQSWEAVKELLNAI